MRSVLVALCLVLGGACERLPRDANAAGESCLYAGESYEAGDSFPAADGCNTCFCEEGGTVACTLALCVEDQVCAYAGQRYTIGASFPAADGCSVCFCPPSGQVGCTQRACTDAGP